MTLAELLDAYSAAVAGARADAATLQAWMRPILVLDGVGAPT